MEQVTFFFIDHNGDWNITAGSTVVLKGNAPFPPATWHHISLAVNGSAAVGSEVCASVGKASVGCVTDKTYKNGFVSIGSSWDFVQFDNFETSSKPFTCGVGDVARIDLCDLKAENQLWTVNSADSSIRLRSDKTKCLTVSGKDPVSGSGAVKVLTCNSTLTGDQIWKIDGYSIVNSNGQCLDITAQSKAQCADLEVYFCNNGANQGWKYTESSGEISTTSTQNMCLAASL